MLDCLTFCAIVYWVLATVYTTLPINVAVCGADPARGVLGALLPHTFGGEVDIDADTWRGYPCNSHLVAKVLFILQRPGAIVTHIMTGGSQVEPFVPVLFVVPILFITTMVLREGLGVQLMSPTASCTLLKFGIAVGSRSMILLKSLLLGKGSLYYKRESNMEFFIIVFTACTIKIPLLHEVAVSGGTMLVICMQAALCPHHFLPEVDPLNVVLQATTATVFMLVNASYQQHCRLASQAAKHNTLAACSAAAGGAGPGSGSLTDGDVVHLLKTIQNTMQNTLSDMVKLTEFLSNVVLVDLKHHLRPPSSGHASRGSNQVFRCRLMKSYGMTPKSMWCMVLGKALPDDFLVAAHLFAVRWERYADIIMGSDFHIDGSQNGIIWCSAIQHEYELQNICFSRGSNKDEFILHVLDKSLLPKKLSSVGQHKNDTAFVKVLGDITFGDLHNKHVKFESTTGKGPYKRALALQARLALAHCAKTYPNDFDPTVYLFDDMSEHEGKEELIKMWLSRLDTGSVVEVGTESSMFPEESVDMEEVEDMEEVDM
ncbi:hypothetical protein VOLCADRAFT_93761 [Volvox carteri f. nagariensis]|uniref:Uncharacterized protein n=1 Tax=Volvox carteri f. nagariensis TaxID=3068 RepID=D8U2Z6_VOLCA|nr:uncharacterized protein VOLCADRAFT_93761 [Volvox carteri f. nagariensis]EFJ45893.1 hypothetical protein VOLCADRAFT_93761 [Volvox carteri f. nagariensis]|eukprot:XP_002952971.1 hypothetical protein VOLCADRAFT_93761 [Volvox carteri f. nagariensis]